MASGQFPTGSSAASKFSLVDPLGGAADDDEKTLQQAVTEEVNNRMGKAVDDLKDKYGSSGKGYEASHDNNPTGLAYQREKEENAKRAAAIKSQEDAFKAEQDAEEQELQQQLQAHRLLDESDDDDEYLEGLDDDPELERIREARLAQLKAAHDARSSNLAKGHGRYREVTQDEFLPEVTGSARVVAHFYHNDFQRCKIMDMHLERLAPAHLEAKFIKINAEKAPFFVQKLQVRVLPCVVIFRDGISVAQVQGFEGLNEEQEKGTEDEWPTGNLAKRLALAKAIDYTASDALDQMRKAQVSGVIRAGFRDAELSDED
eukprot:TRINITY_DN15688_c0_g1_i1.p1 TRINITY_DN15688_c0_g1~~TRINITY_DN15688_c0_g1_i1.p1  ORF type:complete len:358 (-),score=110.64 TRINITY_DN15688_c0_g1_i1:10-960(-)